MAKIETWSLQNHLCKGCGSRVLRREGGPSVATVGGNPIYKCSGCGRQASSFGPEALCWCGFNHKGQYATAYLCRPFSDLIDKPDMIELFKSCGCDPDRKQSEVGIVLENSYRELCKKYT